MLGILTSPNEDMMTYSIGQSINNNSPIHFENGLAVLTFEWDPEDFKKEPQNRGPEVRLDEKADPAFSLTRKFFYIVVDEKGIPKGQIYDSTTNQYINIDSIPSLAIFEEGFISRLTSQANEAQKEVVKRNAYLLRLADSSTKTFLIKR